jgi:chromosome segregation ATPase
MAELGQGEDAMQGFIRHQVISILQPVAETIQDIQAQLEHVRKDLALTDGRVASNKADVEQLERDNLALRGSTKDINSQLDLLQVEATKDSEELARANKDLQANKAALAKLNEKTQHNKAAQEVLQQRFDDLDTMTRLMKSDFGQFDQAFRTHMKNSNQLKDDHSDLHMRHMEQASKVEQAEEKADGTHRAFSKFLKDHRHQCEEDTQILSNLTKHTNELAALLDDTRESLHKQGVDLQTATADIQLLTAGLDHENFGYKYSQLERQHAEMVANLQRTMDNLVNTENTLVRLGDNYTGNKLTVQSILQDLGVKTADNMNSISELAKSQQRQGDVLKDTVMRTDKAERDHKRLYEQQAATEQEVAGIQGVNKVTAERLDAHAQEHKRTRSDLASLNKEADLGLTQLRGDMGAASATLTKLSNRFEACNHNIQGVGKGLQDVHKHTLNGEHNMVCPKSARTITPLRKTRTPRCRTPARKGELLQPHE